MIRTVFKNFWRFFGFEIVSVGNLEIEIARREKKRKQAKIEKSKQFRTIQLQTPKSTKIGSIQYANKEEVEAEANKLLQPATVVLDIGCAFNPQSFIDAETHICCEPFHEYMDRLMMETKDETKYVYLNCDLEKICQTLPPKSVDTVFLIDVIEHIDRDLGCESIANLQAIARSQIIIFTPLGFLDQDPVVEGIDPWGMGGTEWQKHRSGWNPDDFPLNEGWSLVVCNEFFTEDAYGNLLEEPMGAFWAVWSARQ